MGRATTLPASSAPPIARGTGVTPTTQRDSGLAVYTLEDFADLSNIEDTGSIYSIKEMSYSGADVRVFLNIYPNAQRERLLDLYDSRIEEADKEEELRRGVAGVFRDRGDVLQAQNYENQAENYSTGKWVLQNEKAKLLQNTITFLEIAETQTVSISTHREKFPVRALGHVGPRGFSRSARSIAGTMIFTVFNKHPLAQILYSDFYSFEGFSNDKSEGFELPDQLPPMDLTLIAANEYGYISRLVIYGVEFVNEGMTFSIEDLITETQLQYTARDLDPLRPISDAVSPAESRRRWSISGSDLTASSDYQRFKRRSNPFI